MNTVITADLINKCINTQIKEHKENIKLANNNVSSIMDQRYADAMVSKYTTEIEQLEQLSKYIEEHFHPRDKVTIIKFVND